MFYVLNYDFQKDLKFLKETAWFYGAVDTAWLRPAWCRLHVFSFERIDKARIHVPIPKMFSFERINKGRIHVPIPKLSNIVKGELRPEISRLYMKVLTLIKVMFFFDMCNAAAACEDRKPKYWRLWRRHLGLSLTLWRHTVKRDILNMACDCWFPCSCVYWSLVKARKIVWQSQVIDSSSIAQLECVQIQHCTYQRKTLLFAFRPQSPFNN